MIVDLAQRSHLGGGAGHEQLVCEIQIGADELFLDDGVAEVLRDLDDRVARDAGKDRGGEVRCVDRPVLDDEQILPGAVRDVALVGEQNRLVIAGALRLHHGEHRVEIDARCLRHVRNDIRANACPGGDLRADALLHPVGPEVGAPRPAHDHDVDGVARRGDAELPVAEERNRAEIALRHAVRADELHACRAQLRE